MKVELIKEVQALVKKFAERNKWEDTPNLDKFDHLHEELIEMSQHLRYKNKEEMREFVSSNKEIFEDGIGDLFFGLMRLANQLGVDVEKSFNMVKDDILEKYNRQGKENNITKNVKEK